MSVQNKLIIISYKQHPGVSLSLVRWGGHVFTRLGHLGVCPNKWTGIPIPWSTIWAMLNMLVVQSIGIKQTISTWSPWIRLLHHKELFDCHKREAKQHPSVRSCRTTEQQQYAAQEYKWLGIVRELRSYFRQLGGRDHLHTVHWFHCRVGFVVWKRKPACLFIYLFI